ncbi:MAG: oligosaccharide flippase family protein [bacterium]|nr:oligosaccharide flippase family protein [bacterium]
MLKRIIKTSFFSIGSRGFLTLTNLVIMYSISKELGQQELGTYSITAFFYYLFSFLTSFELTTYFGKEIAHKREDLSEIKRLYGEMATTTIIGLALSVLVLICCLLFYNKLAMDLMLISVGAGLVFGIEKNLSGILLGKEKMHFEFVSQIVAFVLVAVPSYYFITGLGLFGIYLLRIVASVVCLGLRVRFTRIMEFLERKRITLSQCNWKEISFFSASGFSFFVQHHIDVFILSFLVPKDLLGAYFLALRIYLSFNMIAEMFSFALTPFISRSFRGQDSDQFERFYSRMLYVQLVLGVCASVTLFFSRHLLVNWFSNEADKLMTDKLLAADFLFYFSFLLFFRFVSYYTGNVLTSTCYQEIRFYILVFSAAMLVLLEESLGYFYSVHGIIAARAVMEVCIFVAYLLAIGRIRKRTNGVTA